jgi:hypothetical protein
VRGNDVLPFPRNIIISCQTVFQSKRQKNADCYLVLEIARIPRRNVEPESLEPATYTICWV